MFGALKSIAGIATAIMVLAVLALIVGVVWWLHSKNAVATKAQETAGHAVVAEHQAQAAQQAQAIVVRGGARDHVDVVLHQENAHAIEAAPGASAPLGAGFVAVFNDRVRLHAAESASPGVPSVQPANPAQLPDANPGSSAPPT